MSEYLDDPNIKHLRPAYGVKDTSTADLIKRLGGIAVEADAQARMGAVQSNLENLQSEAAASRVAETTPQEEMAIGSAISEMGKVDAARRSGGMSEAQYRVRSEAIMKRHMAAAPALSSEIRRRASSTLGFDPAGAAMDVLFD